MKTHTKGNVIVENIKIGDIHYEFEYNYGVQVKVLTLPTLDEDDVYHWKSENVNNNKIIEYAVNSKMNQSFLNLYDYVAYNVKNWL